MPQFPTITDEQKQKILSICISAFVSVLLAVLAVLGYNIAIVQPQQTVQDARMRQLKIELGFEEAAPGEVVAESLNGGGWLCRAGSKPCIDARSGRDVIGYSDNGVTATYLLDGATGTFTHSGFDIVKASTAISLTDGGVIRPTGSFQPLTAVGNVTLTMGITVTAGVTYTNNTVVLLYNTANVSILIADSGNFNGTTSITLGQYDVLAMRYDATSATWVELYTANN